MILYMLYTCYVSYLSISIYLEKSCRPLGLCNFDGRLFACVARRRPLLTHVVIRAIAEDCLQVVRARMHACVRLHELAAGRRAKSADALAD
jgi:hypothetical protein